jgi:hypothetical protein
MMPALKAKLDNISFMKLKYRYAQTFYSRKLEDE